eukprot:gnl/MRDRNA2_/MRDRNA2_179573_c0_seq1.p1 gnl/MRDRNA2_/MRDRNA2_179573_c0~~gnl/MRDRNA2_/MRDRNA2_179573_c0_seq1.p1  ORF type:complete len:341 (+),score=66.98 gnl/MRDRNA2_/MRDRNA2_179573_c0_seq1:102-1025(+)
MPPGNWNTENDDVSTEASTPVVEDTIDDVFRLDTSLLVCKLRCFLDDMHGALHQFNFVSLPMETHSCICKYAGREWSSTCTKAYSTWKLQCAESKLNIQSICTGGDAVAEINGAAPTMPEAHVLHLASDGRLELETAAGSSASSAAAIVTELHDGKAARAAHMTMDALAIHTPVPNDDDDDDEILHHSLSSDLPSLDGLLDELEFQDAMKRCDELLKAFTRGPLHKKENVRILQDLEWKLANPLWDYPENLLMGMSESEKAELNANRIKGATHSRDCFLAAVLGHSWFFEDAEKDEAARRRGWGWNE